MAEERTRRLAAIMFADMVGYTALMQEDEERARALRDRHREVFSTAVPRHHGEILQYYGDGTLSVFASAVEAVECAISVQRELQQAPAVAIRVGVHSGDIVRDRDGVYGDGVNVAARIESLSAAGGILISGKVFDEVKNQASISSEFLGEFRLKNVRQPVKVFAVTNAGIRVPTIDEVRARAGQGADTAAAGAGTSARQAPEGTGEVFLQRVRDRAMAQWALAYLAVAWAALAVVKFLSEQYAWPLLVSRGLSVLAFAGFFVAMVVAWFHGERGRQRIRWTEIAIITVLLLAAAAALTVVRRGQSADGVDGPGAPRLPSAGSGGRPSVAILPFENLSAEPENAYFASGLHDEVITQLLRVSGLRVISRTSVMEYVSERRNVRVIGRELGVSHVTEATVQRIDDRLRVNVQLIDARTDDHLWAERFDRELNDAFAVQSEIARDIALALTTTLTSAERGAMERPPTTNPEAYRFYLQGLDYYLRPGYRQENYSAAQRLFEQATALDPAFALAHAALARVHGLMYWENFDPSPDRLASQRREADSALRLQPDLPQAHLALGWVHYVEGDFAHALDEYSAALEGLPNDAEIVSRIGYTHRRLGNWPEVFDAFRRATELNPRNANLYYDLGGHSFAAVRRYAEAVAAYDQALALAPDLYDAAIRRGFVFVHWQGRLDSLRAAISRIPADVHLPEVDLARADLALWARDGNDLLRQVEAAHEPVFETQLVYLPKSVYAAWAHRLLGNEAAARAAFDSAKTLLEALPDERLDEPRVQAALGFVYAGLGRPADAARSAERSLEAARRGVSGSAGGQNIEVAASILSQANMADAALPYLEQMLRGNSGFTVHTLRLHPLLDPIREHPRFRSLLRTFAAPPMATGTPEVDAPRTPGR